jgi:hypothetical protein
MCTGKKFIFAMFALLLLGILGVALTPHPVAAAGSAPVTVVNTPLAVSGSTSVSGTLAIPRAVLVRDVDNPSRHAWQKNFASTNNTFDVPAGEQLTIEFASYSCSENSNTPPRPMFASGVTTTAGGVGASHFLPANFSGPLGPFDGYYGAMAVRIYADPGTTVTVFTEGPAGSSCDVVLSGNLIMQ